MKKVVVTGASGLLGRAVRSGLESVFDVTALSYTKSGNGYQQVDLTNFSAVDSLFDAVQPDGVIHCAAERRPDVVSKSPEKAQALNVSATEHLCRKAASVGCWVMYISTDYVFDGTSPPYSVTDKPNPLNSYGQMKYEGEIIATKYCPDGCVLRVPILYGPITYLAESAVTVLYEKVQQTGLTTSHDARQRRYPTHVNTVADIIKQLTEARLLQNKEVKGIYHFSEPVLMSKYDMAVSMAQSTGLPTHHLMADTSEPPPNSTPRPYDCRLDVSRLTNEGFTLNQISFNNAVSEILSPFTDRP